MFGNIARRSWCHDYFLSSAEHWRQCGYASAAKPVGWRILLSHTLGIGLCVCAVLFILFGERGAVRVCGVLCSVQAHAYIDQLFRTGHSRFQRWVSKYLYLMLSTCCQITFQSGIYMVFGAKHTIWKNINIWLDFYLETCLAICSGVVSTYVACFCRG